MGVGGKVIALGSCSLGLSRAVAVGLRLISFFFQGSRLFIVCFCVRLCLSFDALPIYVFHVFSI